jgi:endonuclease YncB( thermonuclease family)
VIRWTRASLRGGCAGVLLLLCAPLATADFTGSVVGIVDGDTLEVLHNRHPERIRLSGIDCPEKGQVYGNRAKQLRQPWSLGRKSCARRTAATSTGAPSPMCSYLMAPTSITRWMTKRCSVQDERAICLQLSLGAPPRTTYQPAGPPCGGRAERVRSL